MHLPAVALCSTPLTSPALTYHRGILLLGARCDTCLLAYKHSDVLMWLVMHASLAALRRYVGDSVGRNLYRAKDMHPATVHSRCIVPLEIARYAHGLAPQPVVSLSYTMLGGMRVARNDTQCCGEGYKKSCS